MCILPPPSPFFLPAPRWEAEKQLWTGSFKWSQARRSCFLELERTLPEEAKPWKSGSWVSLGPGETPAWWCCWDFGKVCGLPTQWGSLLWASVTLQPAMNVICSIKVTLERQIELDRLRYLLATWMYRMVIPFLRKVFPFLLNTEAIQDLSKTLEHFPLALSHQCSEVGTKSNMSHGGSFEKTWLSLPNHSKMNYILIAKFFSHSTWFLWQLMLLIIWQLYDVNIFFKVPAFKVIFPYSFSCSWGGWNVVRTKEAGIWCSAVITVFHSFRDSVRPFRSVSSAAWEFPCELVPSWPLSHSWLTLILANISPA